MLLDLKPPVWFYRWVHLVTLLSIFTVYNLKSEALKQKSKPVLKLKDYLFSSLCIYFIWKWVIKVNSAIKTPLKHLAHKCSYHSILFRRVMNQHVKEPRKIKEFFSYSLQPCAFLLFIINNTKVCVWDPAKMFEWPL